jgi:tetratricopeptide (TPR) repeat protein
MTLIAAGSVIASAQSLESGMELYRAYKFADAERALAQVVEAEPENPRAQEYFGLAQLGSGRIDEAGAALDRAQTLDPNSDSIKVGLARVYIEKKQFDQAEGMLQQAAELNRDNADVPLYRGAMKLAQRNYQGAIDDLSEAQSRQTSNAYVHYYAGLAWNGLRKPDRMVDSFQMFLKLAPNAPEAARVRSLLKSVG